jgi:hypothetical protein
MAKGQPDFGALAPTETIVGISDMGELAARLGSIVTFDRRGNIIWMDDFESGIEGWVASSFYGGHTFLWVPTYHRTGGFCARLITGGNTGYDIAITASLPYPILSKMGVEISFLRGANLANIQITLILYDGINMKEGLVFWNASTGEFRCEYTGGPWYSLTPTIQFTPDFRIFNTLKLVCDFTSDKYSRLIANNISYDLSVLPLYEVPLVAAPRLDVRVMIETNTDDNAEIYLDDAILTQNEP